MNNPTKIRIFFIVLLIVINSWIAYRLFNLERIEGNTDTTGDSTVRLINGSEEADSAQREAEIKKKKEDEQKKADYIKALDNYNQKLKPEYDAAVIAYDICVAERKAKKDAYDKALETYYKDLDVYNKIDKPAYDKCLADEAERKEAERIEVERIEVERKEAERKEAVKRAADAGKLLYNQRRVITGDVITGSKIWGKSSGSSIFSRIRPETYYIWNSTRRENGDKAFFKYIYTNNKGSPFNAKMYIIADNYAEFVLNDDFRRIFDRGGWPNLGFTSGLGPIHIPLKVGENIFIFKCRNDGGPAGLAVMVTDENGNRLFNTDSGLNNLNNNSGLNDGWQIM